MWLGQTEHTVIATLHFKPCSLHQLQPPHWRDRISRIAVVKCRNGPVRRNGDFRAFWYGDRSGFANYRVSLNSQFTRWAYLNSAVTGISFATVLVCTANQPSCCSATSSGREV